jgi:hypothetical protein
MALLLCMLTAVASEELVGTLDQSQAMQDVVAAQVLDKSARWPVDRQ